MNFMDLEIEGWDVDKIYNYIIMDIPKDESDIIIMGKSGPTGKTALWRRLSDDGYDVTEISEHICGLVDFKDDVNHLIIHGVCDVIVVLNQRLY